MPSQFQRAFSLMEMVITVAVIGLLAALATVTATHVVSKSHEQKLFSDVQTLNRGITAYLSSGGDLSEADSPEKVLSALKQGFANAARMPGWGGAKIDERLVAIRQTADEASGDRWRAYWNATGQQFELARGGGEGGIKFFELASAPLVGAPGGGTPPEGRSPLLYAEQGNWIWDYAEAEAESRLAPSEIDLHPVPDSTLTPPSTGSPPPPSATTPLSVPTYSVAAGAYPIGAFNMPLTLHNPNSAEFSDVYYSINFGKWQLYSGALNITPGSVVAAQAISRSDLYSNSSRAQQSYTAIPADLAAPVISPSHPQFGLFTGRDLVVTLTDLNSPSVSRIEYRIAGDPWQNYTGTFGLSREDYPAGALIQARAVPLDENHIASPTTLRNLGVEHPSISGTSSGSFSNPKGGTGMITNLSSGQSSDYFAWGRDFQTPGQTMVGYSQSTLEFSERSFNEVRTDHRFEIGSLSYYNGTIVTETGADKVTFTTRLQFDMNGVAQTAAFTFDFELVNVVNTGLNEWADADYVKLAAPVANQIIDFNGTRYQLQIEFGDSTEEGFALFDEFHVIEDRTATTKVYGTLVEVGTINFNR